MRGRTLATTAGVLAAAVVLAACGGGTDGRTSTTSGDAAHAPTVTVATFDGRERPLSAFHRDTPLVVNFWASWCPPCVAEMPDIETVHQQLGDRITILGINTRDDRASAEQLAADTGVTYPLAVDPDGHLFQAFRGRGMPTTILVDADGRIVNHHTGMLTKEDLLDTIRRDLLGGGT